MGDSWRAPKLRGPLPDREAELALARHWSLIQIGRTTPPALDQINGASVPEEFRENLARAVVVPRDGEISGVVVELLSELAARDCHLRFPLGALVIR